ncbi:alcohol dehydrogenase, class V [Scheffersomyces xylosifermentans]|uniref:alcohol dehydrogenase, class V n=1 Tax=Scheffersomyces xylosifermentans TaxID=1304137 RepID=UPI00315CD1FA
MSSSTVPKLFSGYAVEKPENWKEPRLVQYEPFELSPTEITVKIKACGVCGSDCHQVCGNWGPFGRDNLIVGHEIVGEVVEAGSEVTKHKLGDIVAIGAQSDSCGECVRCKDHNEQYCKVAKVETYNTPHPKKNGFVTQGGYASHIRVNANFAVSVPDNLDIYVAAPLLCGGLTVYSPIVRHGGHDLTGKTIGIVGIGGLGSMALQISKALGAKDIYAFSRTSSKKEDALKLGANHFIAAEDVEEWAKSHPDTFDLVLFTGNSNKEADFNPYLEAIKITGTFATISAPKVDEKVIFDPFSLIKNGAVIAGSSLGSLQEAEEVLKLYADNGLKVWIEKLPISEANVKQALIRGVQSDVRYRFVLTDFDKAFNETK